MSTTNNEEKWIGTTEAAEFLGVKPDTIRDWIRKGKNESLRTVTTPLTQTRQTEEHRNRTRQPHLTEGKRHQTTAIPTFMWKNQ